MSNFLEFSYMMDFLVLQTIFSLVLLNWFFFWHETMWETFRSSLLSMVISLTQVASFFGFFWHKKISKKKKRYGTTFFLSWKHKDRKGKKTVRIYFFPGGLKKGRCYCSPLFLYNFYSTILFSDPSGDNAPPLLPFICRLFFHNLLKPQ